MTNESVRYFPKDVAEYANYVVDLIGAADPPTRAMCVVAHQNLKPMLDVVAAKELNDVVRKEGGKPFDFDKFLVNTYRRLEEVEDDPINSRRLLWFLMAMHVTRLDQIVAKDAAFIEHALDVWLLLADAGRYIPRLLQDNIVWKTEEKVWFEESMTEKDSIDWVMQITMPEIYRKHSRVKAFAREHEFMLFS